MKTPKKLPQIWQRAHGRRFRRLFVQAAFCAALATRSVVFPLNAESLLLRPEQATSLTGPWTRPSGEEMAVLPDGSLAVTTDGTKRLFRLMIEPGDINTTNRNVILLDQVDQTVVEQAIHHLQQFAGLSSGSGNWKGASLAPYALKIYDLAYHQGVEPAYLEFKVIATPPAAGEPVGFPDGSERQVESDRGYILVSLTESDRAVPEFNMEGSTPGEKLLKRLSLVTGGRILRFGSTFLAVEDAEGHLLGSLGAQPFRLPKETTRYLNSSFRGQYNSDSSAEPVQGIGGSKLTGQPYTDYADFKSDYLDNPVYQEMRRRRGLAVKTEWDLERNRPVTNSNVLTVGEDQLLEILKGQAIARFYLDQEDTNAPIAAIVPRPSGGGLRITGIHPGTGELIVKTTDKTHKFFLTVNGFNGVVGSTHTVSPQSFVPGWQPPIISTVGTWAEQSRYTQTTHPDWCPVVGCGPVAWALMLSWWDRHGVPAAFSVGVLPGRLASSRTVDAPLWLDIGFDPSGYNRVTALYHDLHDYCDVMCLGGSGATWPSDMIEGIFTQTFIERSVTRTLGMQYSWSWDLTDPDWNEPSSICRRAIWKGRPAVIGLGFLWHYALAYGYAYEEYKVASNLPPLLKRRWFICNEGWGKDKPGWYSGEDTFLGADFSLWQKPGI